MKKLTKAQRELKAALDKALREMKPGGKRHGPRPVPDPPIHRVFQREV